MPPRDKSFWRISQDAADDLPHGSTREMRLYHVDNPIEDFQRLHDRERYMDTLKSWVHM